jgi:hypothetical protein
LFSLIALIKRNTFRNARLTSSSSRGNGTGDGVGLWTGGVSGCGAKAGVIQGGTAGGGEAGLESSSQVRLSMFCVSGLSDTICLELPCVI